jgi:ribosomal protein L37AE/L43A
MVFKYVKGESYKIRCKKCDEKYLDRMHAKYEWCFSCQKNFLEKNFTNWTSGNKIIDEFIQEKQLSIYDLLDKVVEWIPYNQFNVLKK